MVQLYMNAYCFVSYKLPSIAMAKIVGQPAGTRSRSSPRQTGSLINPPVDNPSALPLSQEWWPEIALDTVHQAGLGTNGDDAPTVNRKMTQNQVALNGDFSSRFF